MSQIGIPGWTRSPIVGTHIASEPFVVAQQAPAKLMGGGQDDRVRQTQVAVTGPKLRGPLGRLEHHRPEDDVLGYDGTELALVSWVKSGS